MIEFHDFTKKKYKDCGDFHEGLAWVRNWDRLYGYINIDGVEVIPCQFKNANDFSEGFAAVLVEETWGYIDSTGKMAIEPRFWHAKDFSNGLAVTYVSRKQCGYLDKNGNFIVAPEYSDARDYKNGFGLMQKGNEEAFYFDGKEIHQMSGRWVDDMEEGFAVLEQNGEYNIYDSKMNRVYEGYQYDIKEISGSSCGLFRVVDEDGKVGYLNHDFELEIPCICQDGNHFSDGLAVVNMVYGTIGIIDKEGKGMQFLNNKPYEDILPFSNGFAVAYTSLGQCFIDKYGRVAFGRYFISAKSFSEGLACVETAKDKISYIDTLGNEVIKMPTVYCSLLKYDGRNIPIEADSIQELIEKKRTALKKLKETIVGELDETIKRASAYIDEVEKQFVMTEKKTSSEGEK